MTEGAVGLAVIREGEYILHVLLLGGRVVGTRLIPHADFLGQVDCLPVLMADAVLLANGITPRGLMYADVHHA